MSQALRFLLLSVVLALAPVWAQPPDAPPSSETAAQADPQTQPKGEGDMQGMDMPMSDTGGSMQSMSQSMKAMADMCREMMQREMAMMPAKMAAYAVFGILLITVLALLIVLQVQWIKYWGRLLKSQSLP